jgi:hypothetical protein
MNAETRPYVSGMGAVGDHKGQSKEETAPNSQLARRPLRASLDDGQVFLHQLRRGEGGLCRAQSFDQEEKGEARGCDDHPLERGRDSRLLAGASSGQNACARAFGRRPFHLPHPPEWCKNRKGCVQNRAPFCHSPPESSEKVKGVKNVKCSRQPYLLLWLFPFLLPMFLPMSGCRCI